MQAVREQIRGDPGGVVPVLAPTEEPLLVERPLRGRTKKCGPVDVTLAGVLVDRIIPLALHAVAAVAALAPDDLAQLALLDQFTGPVPLWIRAPLRADL